MSKTIDWIDFFCRNRALNTHVRCRRMVLDSQRAHAKITLPHTETSKLSTLIAGATEAWQ